MRAAVIPFLYCLLLGFAWAAVFRKKFSDSLAPAIMLHIILVLLGGLLLHRLSAGIWGGIALFLGAFVWKMLRAPQEVRASLRGAWRSGLFVFTAFYIFFFLVDSGKRFIYWDDYSHWGMFVKESLRLDALYAESLHPFRHKDYVPATTLFEVIWCRLSGRFLEADVFRALHIFSFALMLPLASCFTGTDAKGAAPRAPLWWLHQLAAAFFAAVALQVLLTHGNLHFYHMAHVDSALGIAFFYCFSEVYRDWNGQENYRALALALGLATLALIKQTGIALLPMFFIFYAAMCKARAGHRLTPAAWVRMFAVLLAPVLLWCGFVAFAEGYADRFIRYERAPMQSYSTIEWHQLLGIFGAGGAEAQKYIGEVSGAFVHTLFTKGLLRFFDAPYAALVACAAASMFAVSRAVRGSSTARPRDAALAGGFILCSGALYAALILVLYIVAFPAVRALTLGSYGRYMSSMSLGILLAALFVYYDSGLWRKHAAAYCLALAAISAPAFVGAAGAAEEILARSDARVVAFEDGVAQRVANVVPAAESVCIFHFWDQIPFQRLRFYLHPRVVNDKGEDAVSEDGLRKCVAAHDWFYLHEYDENSLAVLGAVFGDAAPLERMTLYKAYREGGGGFSLEKRAYAGPEEPDAQR